MQFGYFPNFNSQYPISFHTESPNLVHLLKLKKLNLSVLTIQWLCSIDVHRETYTLSTVNFIHLLYFLPLNKFYFLINLLIYSLIIIH